jgi:ketosteroid isomerase-like protein
MSNLDFVKSVYAAFAEGDIETVLGAMHPEIRWTETAGFKYGGVYNSPQEVLENVLAKIPEDYEAFQIDIERFLDAGDVVIMQGHYEGTGKATGESARAAAVHVLEVADGKVVRFDQYVDSATINPVLG